MFYQHFSGNERYVIYHLKLWGLDWSALGSSAQQYQHIKKGNLHSQAAFIICFCASLETVS